MDGSKNAEGGGFAARNPVLLPLNASFAKVAAWVWVNDRAVATLPRIRM
jgi:hypothetical protein